MKVEWLNMQKRYKKISKNFILNSIYWCLCQNSCSWNVFWKEEKSRSENLQLEPLKNALQDFINKFLKKKYFRRHFRENWRKFFSTISRFWPLRGWSWGREGGGVGWVYLIKKEHLGQKSFSDNVVWNSRKLQKWYLQI